LGLFAGLLVSVMAAAQNETVVAAAPLPAYGFELRTVSVGWEVLLNATSVPGDISDSALYADVVSHGPSPSDYSLYPTRVDGSTVDATNFTATLWIPGGATTVYLIFLANVTGNTFYNASEWSLAVRFQPVVTLNGTASTDVAMVNRNWTARAEVAWPYGDPLSAVSIVWDSATHGASPYNASEYPNASAASSGPAGVFDLQMPAGPNSLRFFYLARVTVGGELFLSTQEYNVSIVPEPILSRDASTPWVFVGRDASIAWSVVWPAAANYSLTEVRWDAASHFPGTAADYPNSAGAAAGSGSSSFSAVVLAPSSPGRIHFILHATILGEDFFARDLNGNISEFTVDVRAEPAFQFGAPPGLAFVGARVPVDFVVVWPYPTDLATVGVYFDDQPHGSPPNSTSVYPGAVAVLNVRSGPFNLSIDPPAAPGAVYFVLRVAVGGVDFLSPLEYQVAVLEAPSVALILPAWELPGAIGAVALIVTWNESLPIDLANIYFDTVSHGTAPDYRLFAQNGTAQSGTNRNFTFTITLPATTGPLYFVGLVRIGGYEFTAPSDAPLAIVEPPSVRSPTMSPGNYALAGQAITVSWSVNFSASTGIASDFRWDTQSHSGAGPNFADYPNASPLETKSSNATFSGIVTAPDSPTTLYGIVRLLLHGRNFYSSQEVTIVVLPTPTLELVSYPHNAQTGATMLIVWRVTLAGNASLVSHTAIHWGLVSKAGQPPSLTNYPGVGGPFRGNDTNFFNTTLPAQISPGHVYFIVHALINNVHFYLPQEFDITVTRPGTGGGGGFLPGADAGAAMTAAAAVAFFVRFAARRPRS
jgi:hypothetical protein